MTTTAAYAALKQPGGRGSVGAGSAMRAEKPEKMVAEMQTLELIDELKTRKNGDDMSWDGFKHILGSYPGIKTKFNNYLNKHETDVVWRSKTQAEQVKEFISTFLDGFDDPWGASEGGRCASVTFSPEERYDHRHLSRAQGATL